MARLELSDVLNFFEYERVRAGRRRRVIDLKQARWVSVGPHLTFVFENRDTVLFQIQEMCRVERITDEAKNPGRAGRVQRAAARPGELSATMFLEIEDQQSIQPVLDRFMGIDVGQHVWLQVGGEAPVIGDFEAGHSDEEKGKLSAVHSVRFRFPPAAARAFRKVPVPLVVDQTAERARVELCPGTKAALLEDLDA